MSNFEYHDIFVFIVRIYESNIKFALAVIKYLMTLLLCILPLVYTREFVVCFSFSTDLRVLPNPAVLGVLILRQSAHTHTYIQCTRTQDTAGTPAHWPAPVIADANAAW